MHASPRIGRPNQKQRTRKDLLDAAARLTKQGLKPSLEEVAQEALVSRATAYRYFPSIEALLLEASVHVAAPTAEAVLGQAPPDDLVARLVRVDEAFQDMILGNEPALRMMLARSLEHSVRGERPADVPARQNRRSALIEAAIAPCRGQLRPEAIAPLAQALAMLIGTEGFVATRDVLQMDDAAARQVKRWAIEALVAGARR